MCSHLSHLALLFYRLLLIHSVVLHLCGWYHGNDSAIMLKLFKMRLTIFLFLKNIFFFVFVYWLKSAYLLTLPIPLQYTNFLTSSTYQFCLINWRYSIYTNLSLFFVQMDYKMIIKYHIIHYSIAISKYYHYVFYFCIQYFDWFISHHLFDHPNLNFSLLHLLLTDNPNYHYNFTSYLNSSWMRQYQTACLWMSHTAG